MTNQYIQLHHTTHRLRDIDLLQSCGACALLSKVDAIEHTHNPEAYQAFVCLGLPNRIPAPIDTADTLSSRSVIVDIEPNRSLTVTSGPDNDKGDTDISIDLLKEVEIRWNRKGFVATIVYV